MKDGGTVALLNRDEHALRTMHYDLWFEVDTLNMNF